MRLHCADESLDDLIGIWKCHIATVSIIRGVLEEILQIMTSLMYTPCPYILIFFLMLSLHTLGWLATIPCEISLQSHSLQSYVSSYQQ